GLADVGVQANSDTTLFADDPKKVPEAVVEGTGVAHGPCVKRRIVGGAEAMRGRKVAQIARSDSLGVGLPEDVTDLRHGPLVEAAWLGRHDTQLWCNILI